MKIVAKPVTIRGVIYPSIIAAATATGVGPAVVSRAARAGTLDGVGLGIQSEIETTWRHQKFPSRAKLAAYLGYNRRTISDHLGNGTLDDLEPRLGSPGAAHMTKPDTAHDPLKSPPPRLANSPISEADHRARWRAWRDGMTAPEACARIEDETGAACKQASYAGWVRAYGLTSRVDKSNPERRRLREVRYQLGVAVADRVREMAPLPPAPPQTSGPALTWLRLVAIKLGGLPPPLRAMPRTEAEAVMATEFVKHHLGLLQAARAAKAEVVA